MTLNDLRPKILSLCGQYGISGANTSKTVQEYDVQIPIYADIGQRELIEAGGVFKTYTYYKTTSTANITVKNGATATTTITITLDGTANNVSVTSGQTVTQVAAAISAVIDALDNYSSAVGGASSSVVTITPTNTHQDDISISYNVGSSGVELETGADKYVKVTDITDFGGLVSIIDETNGEYIHSPIYNIDKNQDIYILNSFKGSLRINYRPALTTPTLTSTLSLSDDSAIQALVFYIAKFLLIDENPALSNAYEIEYEKAKMQLTKRSNIAFEEQIYDVYGS